MKTASSGEEKAMTEVKSNLVLLSGGFPSFPLQVLLRPRAAAQHQGQQPGKVLPHRQCLLPCPACAWEPGSAECLEMQ